MNLTKEKPRVDCVRTENALYALKQPWSSLLAQIPGVPIFLSWEWVHTWWKYYSRDRELWILTAQNGDGELIGIAPWMLDKTPLGPIQVRHLRFLGSGLVCPCHMDTIVLPDYKEEVCAAFLTYLDLYKNEWDVIDLESLTQNCNMKTSLSQTDNCYLERRSLICPYIPLPNNWDTYHKTLKKKLRRNLRYFLNRLERETSSQIAFERVQSADELSPALDTLAAMHRRRWHDTAFNDEVFVQFHHEMAGIALKRGWLRFFQLKVANRAIAALYCFRFGTVFYAYQIGFDPDWRKYSPGRLLIAHVVQQAIRERASEFDWLQGEDEYKFAWTNEVRNDSHFLLSGNWRGTLALRAVHLYDKLNSDENRALPQRFQSIIEQFVAARRH